MLDAENQGLFHFFLNFFKNFFERQKNTRCLRNVDNFVQDVVDLRLKNFFKRFMRI